MNSEAPGNHDLLIHVICVCCNTDELIGWRDFLEHFTVHTSAGESASLAARFRGNTGRGRPAVIDAYLHRILASFGLGAHDRQQLAVVYGPRNAREM